MDTRKEQGRVDPERLAKAAERDGKGPKKARKKAWHPVLESLPRSEVVKTVQYPHERDLPVRHAGMAKTFQDGSQVPDDYISSTAKKQSIEPSGRSPYTQDFLVDNESIQAKFLRQQQKKLGQPVSKFAFDRLSPLRGMGMLSDGAKTLTKLRDSGALRPKQESAAQKRAVKHAILGIQEKVTTHRNVVG